jgi:hypothetical protein
MPGELHGDLELAGGQRYLVAGDQDHVLVRTNNQAARLYVTQLGHHTP